MDASDAQGYGGGGSGYGRPTGLPQPPPGLTEGQQQAWRRELLNLANYTTATLKAVNHARRQQKVRPLYICKGLLRAAYDNSKRIADKNIGWDDGASASFAVRAGYKRQNTGVFVVSAPNNPTTVVNMMRTNEQGRRILLNGNFTYFGIGLYLKAPEQSYGYYWTSFFGIFV